MADAFEFVAPGAFQQEWPTLFSSIVHTAVMCDPNVDFDAFADEFPDIEEKGPSPTLRARWEQALTLICSSIEHGHVGALVVDPRNHRHHDMRADHMRCVMPRGRQTKIPGPIQLDGLAVVLEAARRVLGRNASRLHPLLHVLVHRPALDRLLWSRRVGFECRLVDADSVVHLPERLLALARVHAPAAAEHLEQLGVDFEAAFRLLKTAAPPPGPSDESDHRPRTSDAIRPHLSELARRYQAGEFRSLRAAAGELQRLVNTRSDGSLVSPDQPSYRSHADVYRRLHEVARADPTIWPTRRTRATRA
jgi:hypothetical protein